MDESIAKVNNGATNFFSSVRDVSSIDLFFPDLFSICNLFNLYNVLNLKIPLFVNRHSSSNIFLAYSST